MKIQKAYKQKMAAQLKELDAQIDLIEARLENAGADIRIRHSEELQLLRAKRQAASEKMEELGKVSGDAWETVKETSDKLWDDLRTSLAEVYAKFK